MAGEPSVGARFRFLPMVREGFRPETPFRRERPSSTIPGPITVGVDLTLAARSKDDSVWEREPDPITDGSLNRPSQEIRMYGPGDVIGVDDTQITRLEPEPDSNSFPPNLFPLVEFARPDLPWLFSPERADLSEGKSRNRPWITLVVVEADASEVAISGGGTNPLPVLEAPTSELPSVTESWAWAHAQVVGDDTPADEVIRDQPERVVSRLVCPRNLATNTKYVAAVVPTFEPGRRVGLGRAPYPQSTGEDEDHPTTSITFAWSDDDADPIKLPMYKHWEFHTSKGDFEELANRLSPVRLSDSDVGRREIDVRDPGPDELGYGQPIHQIGALRAPSLDVTKFPNRNQSALVSLLNQPYDLAKQQAQDADRELPVVGAPLYGQWHADRNRIDPNSNSWFTEVNATARYRIAAGLGAEVVRARQEDYVARAWNQVGELAEVNRKLGSGQFARAASHHTYDRLIGSVGLAGEKNAARLLQFTQPLHRTIGAKFGPAGDSFRSFKAEFESKVDFPETVLTPIFRRLSRPNGPLLRNVDLSIQSDDITASSLASDFVQKRVTPASLKSELRQRVATLDDLAANQNVGPIFDDDISIDDDVLIDDGPIWGGTGPFVGGPNGPGGGINPIARRGGQFTPNEPQITGGQATETERPQWNFTSETLDRNTSSEASAPSQWQFTDGFLDNDVVMQTEGAPETVPRDGIALPGESRHVSVRFPEDGTVFDQKSARIARLGTWAHSLPDVDLRDVDLSSITSATPQTFAVRKVDDQIRGSIDHVRTVLGEIQSLSANLDPSVERDGRSASPTTVKAHTDAMKTATFQPLFHTLDDLLSTAPEATPDQVSRDRDVFVNALQSDHDESIAALESLVSALEEQGIDPTSPDIGDSDADPNRSDVNLSATDFADMTDHADRAAQEMRQVLDQLELLRTALRVGPTLRQPPPSLGSGILFGDGYDGSQPAKILDRVDPEVTVTESVLADVTTAGDREKLTDRPDPIEPVAWAPRFSDPMAEELESLAQEYLMPGVSDVPRDSIGALSTDPTFVEAFITGLNHEFARELLWRRFPTDRRGTYFDTFWNKTSNPFSTADDRPDVADLHTWRKPLGENKHGSGRRGAKFGDQIRRQDQGKGRVVLVIRGELLRRFPETTIYMVKSKPDDGAGRTPKLGQVGHVTKEAVENQGIEDVKFPIFQGQLDPDIRFLGFDLAPSDAVGDPDANDPGWFFVFEEPMGETRFGLDTGKPDQRGTVPNGLKAPADSDEDGLPLDTGALTEGGGSATWNGLSWNHLVPSELETSSEHVDDLVDYVNLWDGPPGGGGDEEMTWRVTNQQIVDWKQNQSSLVADYPELANAFAEWGRNSAHMARITWQRPVRVAIHADDLLAPEVGEQ